MSDAMSRPVPPSPTRVGSAITCVGINSTAAAKRATDPIPGQSLDAAERMRLRQPSAAAGAPQSSSDRSKGAARYEDRQEEGTDAVVPNMRTTPKAACNKVEASTPSA
jgi:hypothetical protein